MAIITAQQLQHYYDYYRTTEIIFTRDIIKTLSMDPRQIYVKCSGNQWPCIVNSTSFQYAKIIVGTRGGAFQELAQKDNPAASVRFSFHKADGQLVSFYVAGKVVSISSYMNSKDLAVVLIQYTQRPPDDFIEMIGQLIDANENAVRRREDRIIINADSCRKLGIPREECVISIQNVPRRCILRDLSFGGAKVIVLGLAQFLVGKQILLSLEFDNPYETIPLTGTIIKAVPVEGRKDIFATSIKFDEASLPLSYKVHINNYLSSLRKNELENQAKQIELAQQAEAEAQRIKEQRAQAVQNSKAEEAARLAAEQKAQAQAQQIQAAQAAQVQQAQALNPQVPQNTYDLPEL